MSQTLIRIVDNPWDDNSNWKYLIKHMMKHKKREPIDHSEKHGSVEKFRVLFNFAIPSQMNKKFSALIVLRLTDYPCIKNRRKHKLADKFTFC